ncbi:helix-turn-helix domain-containing protein [Rudaea sp.]|uniref:AraC family transcriptional regulator n=1 Tax=Rudaea sp. TaxID=2136325 RepID=UPI00322090B2
MARIKPIKLRGALHARLDAKGFRHARYWPSPDLAQFVEHYWAVDWTLDEPCVRETLPHPVVHLVAENDEATIGGPATRRWTRRFAPGRGRVFAIKFRVGGFRPFVDGPVSAHADCVRAAHEVFGECARDLGRDVLAAADHHAAVEIYESFLRGLGVRDDPVVDLVAGIAGRIAGDRDITRIEQVATESGLTPRTLQRLFRDYVGASPKWLIQRYRLHEAVARIDAGAACDWAALALDLGYSDQAHLIRDFKKIVGRTPVEYAKAGVRA